LPVVALAAIAIEAPMLARAVLIASGCVEEGLKLASCRATLTTLRQGRGP
jgi:hypothetical protein